MRASRRPLYVRLLRLHHVQLASWQRAVFLEGSLLVALILALGDVASAWILVVLPIAVAGSVKLQDVVTGAALAARAEPPADPLPARGVADGADAVGGRRG